MKFLTIFSVLFLVISVNAAPDHPGSDTIITIEPESVSENVVSGENPVKDLALLIKKVHVSPNPMSLLKKISNYEIITKISQDSVKHTGRLFVLFYTGIWQTPTYYTEILPNDNRKGVEIIPGTTYKYKTQMPFNIKEVSHVELEFEKTGQEEGEEVKIDYIEFKALYETRKERKTKSRTFKPKSVKNMKLISMKEDKSVPELNHEITVKIGLDSQKQTGKLIAFLYKKGVFNLINTQKIEINLINDNENGVEIEREAEYKFEKSFKMFSDEIDSFKLKFEKTGREPGNKIEIDSITIKPLYPKNRRGWETITRTFKPKKALEDGKIVSTTDPDQWVADIMNGKYILVDEDEYVMNT